MGRGFSKIFHRHFLRCILLPVSASSYAVATTICFMMIPLHLLPVPQPRHTP
jgi:hypothetical protein